MDLDELDENRPETKIEQRRPDSLIKIMLATDCHIGVHERDPIRGQDSINSFREVLELAVKHDVDMVLLAGDLFHENRPSRETLYQTIALLREHVMGDKPVEIELMSSPDEGGVREGTFPGINYEDPNLNVGIPVFSIHGNHDDPQGAGGHEGALCALDLLSVTGLVNYIGKMDLPHGEMETAAADGGGMGIVIRPVLLKKGDTKLAVYGVGNVKDQRMHYQLRRASIKMFTPQDKDDWFNIMLLHQNRVKRGPVECVPEGMFDNSLDLIIWGHEHDCRIEPEPVAGKRYYISQPGSTVATSLADGEALTKHVALLEIQDKSFQINPIVLRTVRPFKIDTLHLANVAEEEEVNLNDRMAVNSLLKRKINAMILDARKEYTERVGEEVAKATPMLPIIRLRVDTTGIPDMTNPQRLGLEFQGKIANPRDVIQFIRPKARNAKNAIAEPELEIDQLDLDPKEKVEKVRVGKLVHEYLSAQEMQLLGAEAMNDAIETYVEKEDTHAISNFVKHSEKELRKEVPATNDMDEVDLEHALSNAAEAYEKGYKKEKGETQTQKRKPKKEDDSEAASVDSMLMDEDEESAPKAKAKAAPTTTKRQTTRATPVPAAKPATRGKAAAKPKAPAKGKGKKAVVDSDEDEENFEDVIMDIDESEDESEEVPAPKKGKGRAAPVKRATPAPSAKPARGKKATQTTISFAPSRSKAANKTIDISDSD